MDERISGLDSSTGFLPFKLSVFGTLKQSVSVHFAHDEDESTKTDENGLSSLKTSFLLGMDAVFSSSFLGRIEGLGYYDGIYALKKRSEFESELLDENESGAEINNAYFDIRPMSRADLRLGRQVLTWGVSDNFRVTDTLNPIDYTEPGRKDFAESRLPVLMAKFDIYFDDYHLSSVCVPERRWNRYPVYGSSFYPFVISIPVNEGEKLTSSDMDLAGKISRSFEGWDVAFYTARFRDKTPVLEQQNPYLPLFTIIRPKIWMTGASISTARKNLLFKVEAGYLTGIKFSDQPKSLFETIRVADRSYEKTEFMFGIDYTGIKDTFVTIETLNNFIHGHDTNLEQAGIKSHQFQAAVKLIHFFDDSKGTLTLQSAFTGEKGQGGSIHRIKLGYDLSDSVNLSCGIIFYESGQSVLYQNFGENDMVFLDIKYCF